MTVLLAAVRRVAPRRADGPEVETMATPLMPKATAVWLVQNTALTFDQIADFCGLHQLEVQAIADGEVSLQMQGLDPVGDGQTTTGEIERCQKAPNAWLTKNHHDLTYAQISKLISTTKPTIEKIRERSHWNSPNIKPRHPVSIGLCTMAELDAAVARANRGKKVAAAPAE